MADRLIRLRENQRYVVRGLSHDAVRRCFYLDMRKDEALNVIIDATGILDTSETITAEVTKSDGVTASVSESSGVITLQLSALTAQGDVDIKITRSGGQIHKLTLKALTENSTDWMSDYNTAWGFA